MNEVIQNDIVWDDPQAIFYITRIYHYNKTKEFKEVFCVITMNDILIQLSKDLDDNDY